MTRLPLSVDLVIPTWNRRDLVLACLASLPLELENLQVIVVDNGSVDGTAEAVAALHSAIRVVAMPRNIGFGRAVNAGAATGDGDVVATVNNDTIVEAGMLPALVEPLLRDSRVGSVAAVLLNASGSAIDAAGIEIDRTLLGYSAMHGLPVDRLATAVAALGPCGGAAAYRRSAFDAVGGFDPEIFAYSEDVDLALRLQAAGWGTALATGARVRHRGGETAGRGSRFQTTHAAWARGYLLGRYRVGVLMVVTDLVFAAAGAARSRSLIGVWRRVDGWRRGRSLRPRRACATPTVGFLRGVRRQLGGG